MEMTSRVITKIRSTLEDLQLVREVYFEYEEQILIKIVMHKLGGLITFLTCTERLDINGSNHRSPGSQKDKIFERQKRMKTGLESLLVRVEDVCNFVGNNEFDKSLASMESLEGEIDEWFTSLSDYLNQSCPCVLANQVTDIFLSVLSNLDDIAGFQRYIVGALADPTEALMDNILFLYRFINFATLENMEFQDLLTQSYALAISAAHLTMQLFSSSHYNFKVLYGDVENSRENFPPDAVKSMIAAFLLKINLAHNSDLYEAYSRALVALRGSRELYLPTLDNDDIYFLQSSLWVVLQLNAGPSVSFFDQLGALYKGLKTLANILNLLANKDDGDIKHIAGAAIFDAGIIVFSLHQKDFDIGQEVHDFIETVKVIQAEVGELVGSSSKFNFPNTNILGFLDFLLDYLKEVNSTKVDADVLSHLPGIREHIVFIRTLVGNLQMLRNQEEGIHQNLFDLSLKVAFKIECLIDQLVLGRILSSFSTCLQSITEDVEILKTGSRKVFDDSKVLQEETLASTHWMPSESSTTEVDESMDTVELLYKCLPDHLKSCLLSFGAFSKGEEVSVKRLIWFWIAEGFVRRRKSKSLQEVATDYLKYLIQRSLVISVKERSGGGIKTCCIDDLVHAFCLNKANEELFMLVLNENGEPLSFDEPENLRRLCINSNLEHFMESKPFYPHLRSLLCFHPREWHKVNITFIFRIYKLLRVLDMEKLNIHCSDFDGEVGLLVQLRYLAIQATYEVSPSIGNLSNLEFFVLYPAREGIVKLPHAVWNMQNLRHLYLICESNEFSGIHFPVDNLDNSHNLLELESLSGLHSEHWGIMEKQLRKCPNMLRLKCWLSESDDPLNGVDVMSFSYLSKLESLSLSFDENSTEFEFHFPETIKKLALRGCGLSWEKMSKIAELPNLEVLKLLDESFIGDTWHMDEGQFVKLTFLKLVSLSIVKWTASDDQCTKLKKLILEDCPKLEAVPKCLESVGTLELIEVKDCPDSVSGLLKKVEDCQRGAGNSVLKVHVHSARDA